MSKITVESVSFTVVKDPDPVRARRGLMVVTGSVTVRADGFADSDEEFGPWEQEVVVEGLVGDRLNKWKATRTRALPDGAWEPVEGDHHPLEAAPRRTAVIAAQRNAIEAIGKAFLGDYKPRRI